MSFINTIESYRDFDFHTFFAKVQPDDIDRALNRDKLSAHDFLVLLSPLAADFLEPMAQKAHRLTVQYFGRTIQLFIPLYISNYCTNECVYCGFNRSHGIERRKLSLAQIESEAKAIAATGMRHLLLLTGEARFETPLDYLEKPYIAYRFHMKLVSFFNRMSRKNSGVLKDQIQILLP